MADTGDWWAGPRLTSLLAERGAVEQLRARAAAGDEYTAFTLVDWWTERCDAEQLLTEVDAGTPGAADRYLTVLEQQDPTSASQIRRFGRELPE